MNDSIYFADPELAFHVWVRERAGAEGYKWVLREASITAGRDGVSVAGPGDPEAEPGTEGRR